MALKPDREILATTVGFYFNQTSNPGVVVCVSGGTSGADLDGTSSVAAVFNYSSGLYPLGVLLDEFVNIDQSLYNVNNQKAQANVGDKASIVTKGTVTTNMVDTATAGKTAVLGPSGYITDQDYTQADADPRLNPVVGRWRTGKDQNGYATLSVDL